VKPYNDRRVLVEYARIHRVVVEEPLQPLPDFGSDLFRLLTEADGSGYWREREWLLGNLEATRSPFGGIQDITGRFGWYADIPSADVPPPYDPDTKYWDDDLGRARHGALALFLVDPPSQWVAVTSRAGDVSTAGFAHALANLLNKGEYQTLVQHPERPEVDWLVDTVTERGVFDSWARSVDRIGKIRISFHLPNPNPTPDIAPIVNYLNEMAGTKGAIEAEARDGGSLDPFGSELTRSGLAMVDQDYGSVTAHGQRGAEESHFYSAGHVAKDTIRAEVAAATPNVPGVFAKIRASLAARLTRGGNNAT
jgi:hypothetical protein